MSFSDGVWTPSQAHFRGLCIDVLYDAVHICTFRSHPNTRMDNNAKKFIREYIEARGGKDALTEDEKKALVELAKNRDEIES